MARNAINFTGAVEAADDAVNNRINVTVAQKSTQLGNLGTAQTITLSATQQHVYGTLNANLVLTVSGLAAGRSAVLVFKQDATGGRTLTVNGVSQLIPTDAGADVALLVFSDGSSNPTVANLLKPPPTGSVGATTLVPIEPTGIGGDAALTFGGTGIYPGRTRIKIPTRTAMLARFHTPASLSPASPAGVTADTSPDHPSGAITMTTSGFTARLATQAVSPAADISNKIVRAPCKVTSTNRASLFRCRMMVTSAAGGTDFTNYRWVDIQPQNAFYQIYDVYQNFAIGPSEWKTVGTGANLSAITGIRFWLESNASADVHTLSVSHVESVPMTGNANGRASLVMCFDDWNTVHWSTVLPKFEAYNFPAVLTANIAQASDSNVRNMIWHMIRRYGWQVMSHAYTNTEHVDASGNTLRTQHAKIRQRAQAILLHGGEDWAWYGGLSHTEANVNDLNVYYRTGRLFLADPVRTETLPPMNPMRIVGWGQGTTDMTDGGAAMIDYINKARAQKGLAVITWHSSFGTDIDNVLAHADANRADLDVQTMEDALRPWIVER